MLSVSQITEMYLDVLSARPVSAKQDDYNRALFAKLDLGRFFPSMDLMSDEDLDYCIRMHELCTDLYDRAGDNIKFLRRISKGMSQAFEIVLMVTELAHHSEDGVID